MLVDVLWGLAELRPIELNLSLSLLLRKFRVSETMSVIRRFVMQVRSYFCKILLGFPLLLIHMWFNDSVTRPDCSLQQG
jgi:hypothetical protein